MKVRWPKSIFLKIVLVLVATGFLINMAVGFFFRHIRPNERNRYMVNNVERYLNYLVEDFAHDDAERAKSKAQRTLAELGFHVRFEKGTTTWATDDKIPSVASLEQKHWYKKEGYGHKHGNFYKLIRRGSATYLFVGRFAKFATFSWQTIVYLVLAVFLIIFLAWYLIRRMLAPIKALSSAISTFGHELNVEVAVRSKDELGELSVAFNQMTKRINEMIEAKDQLLLNVSHEIRTPLTRMNLALAMMPENSQKESIEGDVKEMQTMITEILESERLNSQHGKNTKEELNLSSLISSRAAMFDNVNYHEPDPITIRGDQERIQLLLKNLIENALKYSDKPVDILLSKTAEFARMVVKDHGIGIEQNEISKLFEPFYRTDPARSRQTGGYGLGLSLCKKIVEYHGGQIEIKSQKGEGTEVIVLLPLPRN